MQAVQKWIRLRHVFQMTTVKKWILHISAGCRGVPSHSSFVKTMKRVERRKASAWMFASDPTPKNLPRQINQPMQSQPSLRLIQGGMRAMVAQMQESIVPKIQIVAERLVHVNRSQIGVHRVSTRQFIDLDSE